MILDHAEWVLFGWVLANQGGVPMPVVPVLLAAGALAASGRLSIVEVFAVAVGATLCADLGWYGVGRWRGAGVLALLGRLSPRAKAFVRRAQDGFLARAGTFQLTARFLPELNPIASGLAGATGLSITRFVGYGVVSALIWAGTWTGIGYLLGDAVVEFAVRFGIHVMGFLLAALLLCLVVRRARRYRLLRMLQKARITPDELKARLERGERVTILDVREADEVARAPYMLPGALWIKPDDLPQRLRELPRDGMVVLYGRRLKRAKSERAIPHANVALRLCGAGFGRVRPLTGGLHAWRRRGYPVQMPDAGPHGGMGTNHQPPVDEQPGSVATEPSGTAQPGVAQGRSGYCGSG
jgi:membrane protein DedA with SNARE-associated domain/rhodanese-related sulfurtransferase